MVSSQFFHLLSEYVPTQLITESNLCAELQALLIWIYVMRQSYRNLRKWLIQYTTEGLTISFIHSFIHATKVANSKILADLNAYTNKK